jgi:hypothetical protein
MVGLIAVAVVGVLLLFSSCQHHQRQQGVEIYRFPTILIRALQVGSFVRLLIGVGIYTSFPYHPRTIEIAILWATFGAMTLIVLASADSIGSVLFNNFVRMEHKRPTRGGTSRKRAMRTVSRC